MLPVGGIQKLIQIYSNLKRTEEVHRQGYISEFRFQYFPLVPEGMLAWEKTKPYKPGEKIKWDAHESDNYNLSTIIAREIKNQGFKDVSAACNTDSVWIEFTNTLHLSDARSLGQIGSLCDTILPERITLFYLNIKEDDTVIQSLKTTRGAFRSFMDSGLDKEGFLAFSKLNLYKAENWEDFNQDSSASELYDLEDDKFFYSIEPKIRTFLNNKAGFFKHKGVIQAKAGYNIWSGAQILGELEWTVFNQYDELIYDPLEDPEKSVRTDLVDYEAESALRMSMLALEQKFDLPLSTQGRAAVGYFESAYAGVGAEAFRYFKNGLFGAGLETQFVRKRDPQNNYKLRDGYDKLYKTAFLNLYAQILPSQGIEAGLKIGQFLAGDVGFQIDLRRSFKYFTLGGWYTKTDTDLFESVKNRGSTQTGVFT